MNDTTYGLDQIIGERIRHRREARGYSTRQFARMLDVSVQELNRYERGTARVSAQRLQRAAQLLDTSVPYFFQGLDRELFSQPNLKVKHLFKRAAYDYLKNLIDHVADPIFVKNRDHQWIDGNKAFWELMGGPPEKYIGKSDYDCFSKEEADVFWERDNQVFLTGETVINEEYLTDPKGIRHILSTKKTLFQNGSGEPVLVGIIRDITIERELEELRKRSALFQKEQQYRSVFNSANDAIFIFGMDGHILEANAAASKIYGYTHDEFVRMRGTDFTPPEDFREFSQFMEKALSGTPDFIEGIHLRKDGTPILVEISGTSFSYNDETHLLAVIRDITERKRAQLALEESDRRKDQFLAMLSHELRNPLAPISNAMYILQSSVSDEVRKETVQMVNRQISQITHLLNDLLDVSRITLGKIKLQRENLTLAQIIDMAVENTKPLITEKAHELTVNMPGEPIWIHGDPTRLTQVFSNLLNNAAKYTEEGGKIALNVVREGADVVVSIKDNGTGIAKEMLPHVFDLFAQEDNSFERSRGGLGIGLTLVQKLVQMHDGRIEANSDGKGKGSEFTVRLPVQALLSMPAGKALAADGGEQRIQKVLVVDDNVASAKTLGWSMEILGHHVRIAHSGEEAIALAQEFNPAVILLDIGLPGMNGFDVCKKLRAIPALKEAVIIAQTGWGNKEHIERSREAGFNYHLRKPIEIDKLEHILNHLHDAEDRLNYSA